MKAIVVLLAVCLLGQKTHAWGGLFNRFSPEMLANMGYGGHGGFMQVITPNYINFCLCKTFTKGPINALLPG